MQWLVALHERLRPFDLHFGFRTRDEMARFVGFALESPLGDGFAGPGVDVFVGAIDAAVLMKVLPKFHGPRAKLSAPLTITLAWAISPDDPDEAKERIAKAVVAGNFGTADALLKAAFVDGGHPPLLLRVATKTARMLSDVHTVGFASFA
jgi:hypothetical protein